MQDMELTVGQVKEKLDAGDKLVMLDVREPNEWDFAHIDGATHIPLGELEQRFGELGKDDEIVAYCHHGGRSLQAARFLQAYGYNARSMNGGIEDWSAQVDPSVPRY